MGSKSTPLVAPTRRSVELPSVEFEFFIAHASQDRGIAEDLYDRLSRGSSVFLASQSLVPGTLWPREIALAQRKSAITVVLVSLHTSEAFYQQEEIASAIAVAREYPHARRVVPVYLTSKLQSLDVPYGLRQIHSLNVASTGKLKPVADALRKCLKDLAKSFALAQPARVYIEGRFGEEPSTWWATKLPVETPEQSAEDEVAGALARLESYWERRSRDVFLLYADLDHFQGINKRHGARVGDEIIAVVDRLFRDAFEDGVAERIRRDEYVAAMEGSTSEAFFRMANRLRTRIARYDWSSIATELYVTISGGIVKVDHDEQGSSAVLRAIQGSLKAKRAGGGRFEAGPITLSAHVSKRIIDYGSD